MNRLSSSFISRFIHYKKGTGDFLCVMVLFNFCSFFVQFPCYFFHKLQSMEPKMDYFYGLQRSLQHFFHFYFYLVLCNITKRSIFFPACFSLKKSSFLTLMMTFSTPVFLVFSVAVHSVQKLSMILFSLVLIPNRKVRHFFMFAIRSAQCLLLDIH